MAINQNEKQRCNIVSDHLLPSIHQRSFLELLSTSSEVYAILLVENFNVALEMSGGENLFLIAVSKTEKNYFIIFIR